MTDRGFEATQRPEENQSGVRKLERIPFKIEIPTVSEEVYAETRKAVEKAIPWVFIVPIRAKTMEELLIEDKQREQDGQPRRLGFVHESKSVRATVPPEMEVFIDPYAVRIEGSDEDSTDDQKAMIAKTEASFRNHLPATVAPYVSMIMADPSTMSQLEDRYMDKHNGVVLLPNFEARTDVSNDQGGVVSIGRPGPNWPRSVNEKDRDRGAYETFAVPVGVLPRKMSA